MKGREVLGSVDTGDNPGSWRLPAAPPTDPRSIPYPLTDLHHDLSPCSPHRNPPTADFHRALFRHRSERKQNRSRHRSPVWNPVFPFSHSALSTTQSPHFHHICTLIIDNFIYFHLLYYSRSADYGRTGHHPCPAA